MSQDNTANVQDTITTKPADDSGALTIPSTPSTFLQITTSSSNKTLVPTSVLVSSSTKLVVSESLTTNSNNSVSSSNGLSSSSSSSSVIDISNVENSIQEVSNVVLSNSDTQVLYSAIQNLRNMSVFQDKSIFDYSEVNMPALVTNDYIQLHIQDYYGNKYSDDLVFYHSDGSQFGIAYMSATGEISTNQTYFGNKKPEIFKLYQNITPTTYYVYAFNDILNNQISYHQYSGEIKIIDNIPYGTQVPYYDNLVEKQTIDINDIEIRAYETTCRNDNNEYIVLKQIDFPEMSISYDGTITPSLLDYKLLQLNDFKPSSNNKYEIGNLTVSQISTYVKDNISKYSFQLPSKIVSISYDSYTNGSVNTNAWKLNIKQHTLFVPTLVYTYVNEDENKYEYIPYTLSTGDNSQTDYITCTVSGETNNEVKLEFNINLTGKSKVTVNNGFIEGNAYLVNNNELDFNNQLFPIYLNGQKYYELYYDDNCEYSFYFNVSSIVQDEDYNYVEFTDIPFIADDLNNHILNILVVSSADTDLVRLNVVKDTANIVYLFNNENIVVNNVYEKSTDMTYITFLQQMSTTYNVEYVDGMSLISTYVFDKNISSIKYQQSRLYERDGIEMSYVYYSPKTLTYEKYINPVLQYKGAFFGSDIFDTYTNNMYVFNEVFQRSYVISSSDDKTLTIDSIKDTTYFLKDNYETIVSTYTSTPFTLMNDYNYEFDKYEYHEPVVSYVISAKKLDYENIAKETTGNYGTLCDYCIETEKIDDGYLPGGANFYIYFIDTSYYFIDKNGNNDKNNESLTKQFSYDTSVLKQSSFYNLSINKIDDCFKTLGIENGNIYDSSYGNITLNDIRTKISPKGDNVFFVESTSDTNGLYKCLKIQFSFTSNQKINYEQSTIGNLINENGNKTITLTTTHNNISETYFDTTQSGYVLQPSQDVIYGQGNVTIGETNYTYFLKYSCNYKVYLKSLNGDNNTYIATQVVTQDGFWERKYTQNLKPLLNISYTYASNSLDISNAYIVPTVRNERLGFIQNHKISYNVLEDILVEEYVYTYFDEQNVQCKFIENESNKIINLGDNKYVGLKNEEYFVSKYTLSPKDIITYTFEDNLISYSFNCIEVSLHQNNSEEKDNKYAYFNILQTTLTNKYFYFPIAQVTYTNKDNVVTYTISDISVSWDNSTERSGNTAFKTFYNSDDIYIYEKTYNNIDLIINLGKWIKYALPLDNGMNVDNVSTFFVESNTFYPSFKKFNRGSALNWTTRTIKTDGEQPINVICLYINYYYFNSIYCDYKKYIPDDVEYYNLSSESFINTTKVDLYRRLTVNTKQEIKEYVIQEEELIPQYAQIDTPFGLVNGKKVIVTDQVYVPETYTTVVSIDPETGQYFTERVLATEAYMAYSYDVEDIPLITAAYIFNGDEGIKIQGLDTLIEKLTGISTTDSDGNTIIPTTSTIPQIDYSKFINLEPIQKSLNTYLSYETSSLVYINEAIDRNTKNISESINNNNSQTVYSLSLFSKNVSDSLEKTSSNEITSNSTNFSNLINAQKNMVSKISDSINNQTSTLSRMMLVSMLGQTGSYESATAITNVLSNMSASIPKNWQSVNKIGYQTTSVQEVVSYRATGEKHTKVISKEQRASSYKTVVENHKYDYPSYVSFSYFSAFEDNSSTTERVGLHLKKESRDFSYNGYLYHEDYYTYQNIADILADLHVSQSLPTRKEFIVDVSKRLYINSDFIFSYTSPNEYAKRAIYRADVLWTELVKANVVESEELSYRPLPQIPEDKKKYWWLDATKLSYFAYAFNLDLIKLQQADQSVFTAIDSVIGLNKEAVDNSDVFTVTNITVNSHKVNSLSYIWNVTNTSLSDSVLSKLRVLTKDYENTSYSSAYNTLVKIDKVDMNDGTEIIKRSTTVFNNVTPIKRSSKI